MSTKDTNKDDNWQELLSIKWPDPTSPQSLCDQSGECCRGASQYQPWETTLINAGKGDKTARDFLNQFTPYPSQSIAKLSAPDAVKSSRITAQEQDRNPDEVVFYRCQYLKGKNECQIYEDRPTLCREFPESPFGSIPSCCGYASTANACHNKLTDLKKELEALKTLQNQINPLN